jgi:hypothetical protein
MAVDYRVRAQLIEGLQTIYIRNENQPCAPCIVLQIAFCYQIAFGVVSDDNQQLIWLQIARNNPEISRSKKKPYRLPI